MTTLCTEFSTVRTLFSENGATVIADGELDLRAAPELRRALSEVLDQRPQWLILDLADVTFIDCAAARVLAAASRALPGSLKAVIRRPSRPVRRVLALSGLSACF